MKKTGLSQKSLALIGLAVVVAVVGILAWTSYNNLVTKDQDVQKAFANIEAQYQRRFDLIPNLVNVVQSYAGFEQETLTRITELRSQWQTSTGLNERVQTANQFESTLSRLLLVAENYPDLKASTQFTSLQDSLAETENMIVVSRTRFNDAVRDYNLAVRTFPSNFFAGLFGFTQKEFFEVLNDEAATAPVVDIQIPGN